jgi:two-component system NarL family sensor kinase
VRYALESARRRLAKGAPDADSSLEQGIENLGTAITEVRRISRDLRPGVLDDLGLGPALKTLVEDFEQRTGIATDFETVVFRNRLDSNAKTALYRIAQEALTNIERHASATRASVDMRGHKNGATLKISDNGCGINATMRKRGAGIGLRNMEERVEQLDGHLIIRSSHGSNRGTVILATVPLTRLLSPEIKAQQKSESDT